MTGEGGVVHLDVEAVDGGTVVGDRQGHVGCSTGHQDHVLHVNGEVNGVVCSRRANDRAEADQKQRNHEDDGGAAFCRHEHRWCLGPMPLEATAISVG